MSTSTASPDRVSGEASRPWSRASRRAMSAAKLRALRKGQALVLATGVLPILVRLRPYFAEPNSAQLAADNAAEEAAIVERAKAAEERENA